MAADLTRDSGGLSRHFDPAEQLERDAQADRDWERETDRAIRHEPAPDEPETTP